MERLTKGYGRNRVLSVESIQLDEGDRVAIYGDNGSGKSTLLRILAGLVRRTGGKEFRDERWKSASVGFLPQTGGVYLDLSVRDNLQAVHCLLGTAPNSDRLSWLIERFGLTGLLDKRVATLSGGYRRLAALACLFSSGANYLFLDEPFASIDPTKRLSIEETLTKYSDEFPLIVISEHVNNIDAKATSSFWNKEVRLEAHEHGRNVEARAVGVL
ncbi:ABC transporter ATP-binding protein [Bradyrhizobium sp. ISRA442]|uniref:ABC transporter ATP-binding protein n=1 Tax=Bradyrhizobium sp. ISRA442 TaxID=2866197 RepID=UPI00311AE465